MSAPKMQTREGRRHLHVSRKFRMNEKITENLCPIPVFPLLSRPFYSSCMSTFSDNLLWRYAVKKFDPAKKLTVPELDGVLNAARLAPSSYGLQPYKLLVVTDPDLRARIRNDAAYDQPQVTDSSHLLIFCAKTAVNEAYVDEYVAHIAAVRGVTTDSLKAYRDTMVNSVQRRKSPDITVWCQKQAYIALGFLLTACAQAQIDSCPMEGFDPAKVDEILGLQELGLTATVFCPVGYRSADDPAATKKKVRMPAGEFVIQRQ